MIGCTSGFTTAIPLFCFLSLISQKLTFTRHTIVTKSGVTRNSHVKMTNRENGNLHVDDGWANVSKRQPRKNRTSKNHNPYIEVIDLKSNEANYNVEEQQPSETYEPFMVMLVGLPGSGKSTFAETLVVSMPNKFCRINQDELKTRQKCERKVKQVLSLSSNSSSPRLCPIIDRCNFDAKQRLTWYRLAEEAAVEGSLTKSTGKIVGTNRYHNARSKISEGRGQEHLVAHPSMPSRNPGIPVDVIVFDLPFDECLRRCKVRKGHETIKSPQQAAGVLKQLRSQWSPPHYQKNRNELSRYRSLTVVRTDKERKECLLRVLKQTD
mmetsp:Transcript_23127/g.54680  ORF Transcript_23127/g.54680 Transcript_23127/m.54680 type:complete len:323 (+) Transcript_23127:164-1132(+)